MTSLKTLASAYNAYSMGAEHVFSQKQYTFPSPLTTQIYGIFTASIDFNFTTAKKISQRKQIVYHGYYFLQKQKNCCKKNDAGHITTSNIIIRGMLFLILLAMSCQYANYFLEKNKA